MTINIKAIAFCFIGLPPHSPPKKTKAPLKKNAISCNNSSAKYVI